MEGYDAKKRNKPFRDWINHLPANKRVPIMQRIGKFIGKSFHAVKSYRSLAREISPVDCIGIQEATRIIAFEEGINGFVKAKQIYPDLYEAFKQGDQKEHPDGKEASATAHPADGKDTGQTSGTGTQDCPDTGAIHKHAA